MPYSHNLITSRSFFSPVRQQFVYWECVWHGWTFAEFIWPINSSRDDQVWMLRASRQRCNPSVPANECMGPLDWDRSPLASFSWKGKKNQSVMMYARGRKHDNTLSFLCSRFTKTTKELSSRYFGWAARAEKSEEGRPLSHQSKPYPPDHFNFYLIELFCCAVLAVSILLLNPEAEKNQSCIRAIHR